MRKCKFCGQDVDWRQNPDGSFHLINSDSSLHHCLKGKVDSTQQQPSARVITTTQISRATQASSFYQGIIEIYEALTMAEANTRLKDPQQGWILLKIFESQRLSGDNLVHVPLYILGRKQTNAPK